MGLLSAESNDSRHESVGRRRGSGPPVVRSSLSTAGVLSQAYFSRAVSRNRKRGTRRTSGSQIHADDNEEAFTGTVARARCISVWVAAHHLSVHESYRRKVRSLPRSGSQDRRNERAPSTKYMVVWRWPNRTAITVGSQAEFRNYFRVGTASPPMAIFPNYKTGETAVVLFRR